MQVIKRKLPSNLKEVEILPLADWHIGDKFCDMELIKSQINYIQDTENAYCVLNGDLINNATKTSVSDCYAEDLSPMEQLTTLIDLLSPIKDKILAITSGNHEKRTYKKEGIDLTEVVARELKIQDLFSKASAVIFLSLGKSRYTHKNGEQAQVNYVIYINHGSGGGKKEGAKAIRLADMASIVDADVYIHSHTHLPMIMKENFYRVDTQNKSVIPVSKLFVNTASALNHGGYGEECEYKPNSKDNPIIYLDGTKKRADAKL